MIDQAVLTLVLGLALLALGVVKKQYLVLSGLVWIFSAVAVFPTYTSNAVGWVVISLGVGLFVLAEGAMSMLEGSKDDP